MCGIVKLNHVQYMDVKYYILDLCLSCRGVKICGEVQKPATITLMV